MTKLNFLFAYRRNQIRVNIFMCIYFVDGLGKNIRHQGAKNNSQEARLFTATFDICCICTSMYTYVHFKFKKSSIVLIRELTEMKRASNEINKDITLN